MDGVLGYGTLNDCFRLKVRLLSEHWLKTGTVLVFRWGATGSNFQGQEIQLAVPESPTWLIKAGAQPKISRQIWITRQKCLE